MRVPAVRIALVLIVTALGACTSSPVNEETESAPEIEERASASDSETQTRDGERPESGEQARAGAAAIDLLEQARVEAAAGRGEIAAKLLQRAISIEPRNPWLWHRLAVLRLQQGQYKQAIGNARKSIALAGENQRLIAGNEEVIRRASTAQP